MNPVFLAQWMKEKRSPWIVVVFCVLSIIATLLFAGGMSSKLKIGVFPASGVDASVIDGWLERLNESSVIEFVRKDEQKARAEVREGRADAAVQLMEADYRIIAAIERPNVYAIEQHVHAVFMEELQLRAAAEYAEDAAAFQKEIERDLKLTAADVQLVDAEGNKINEYDMSLQLLFAFTLFLVMFTIGFKVNAITTEKVSGIWNRLILSPVTKTEMYMGHLMYSFIIGFAQILAVMLLFRYAFHFDLGDQFGMLLLVAALYSLSIVAFSMLVTGIVRTPEQFNSVFPSIVPMMPLLSGAYMPPETITNEVLLALAELFPLKHAMDAMMAIAMYDAGWADYLLPVAKLSIICVICMGIGINLVERRRG